MGFCGDDFGQVEKPLLYQSTPVASFAKIPDISHRFGHHHLCWRISVQRLRQRELGVGVPFRPSENGLLLNTQQRDLVVLEGAEASKQTVKGVLD